MTAAIVALRWLHEAALMGLFGAAAFSALLQSRLPALPRPALAGLSRAAAGLALITAPAWMALVVAEMAGDARAAADPAILWLGISATLFGNVFVARFILLLLLCAAVFLSARARVIALLAGAALALIAVTSHAAEASPAHFAAIGMISDGLHLLTAGFWIGGLVVLAALFVCRAQPLAMAVGIFAEWGMIAVSLLVLTGLLNAATILLGGTGHDSLVYLGVLAAKLVCVAAMVGLALVNHFRLLPALADPRAARDLSVNIRRELTLGLFAVLLASLLTMLQPVH